MPNTNGLLLLAGVGALLFLGRGAPAKKLDEDKRFVSSNLGGAPLPPSVPAFDIQRYIDGLFGDPATVPEQPPMQFFFPPSRTVTSSGVPGSIRPPPDIVTDTTKVAIGGDGGETITESALAVRRIEQIERQEFNWAANVVTPPTGSTAAANRLEEARQKAYAAALIAKYKAEQVARNAAVVARTRAEQERLATPPVVTYQPTINFDANDQDWTISPLATAGQTITVFDYSSTVFAGEEDDPQYSTVFAGEEDDSDFVLSAGMDSPTVFAGEEDDDSQFSVVSMEPAQDFYGAYGGEE